MKDANTTAVWNSRLSVNKALIGVLLLIAGEALAASPAQTWHGLGIGVQGGMETVSSAFGPAADFNLTYELEYQRFLFSIGAGIGYGAVFSRQKEVQEYTDMDDEAAAPVRDYDNLYALRRTTRQNRSQSHCRIHIPVLLGGHFGSCYFMIGAAVAFPFYAAAQLDITETDEIAYNAFYDDFNSHPFVPAGQRSYSLPVDVSMPAVDIVPMVEMGWYPGNTNRHTVRVAVFAEYGVNTHSFRAGLKLQYIYRAQRSRFPCHCMVF